jgi:hypothetical protein
VFGRARFWPLLLALVVCMVLMALIEARAAARQEDFTARENRV